MKVKVQRLHPNAVLPAKAHPTDAGFDLVATSIDYDRHGNIVYGTGLAFEIPEGHVGLLFPRSSISKKDLALANAVGVVDSHYRGEVTLKFRPTLRASDKVKYLRGTALYGGNGICDSYEVGDRIGQLIIMPLPDVLFLETDTLSATDRGTGGYGSTGK